MKVLIAIVSCHARPDWRDLIRSTWFRFVPSTVDVKFFLGRGVKRESLEDEVFIDCDDSYAGLPDKVQSIIKWALERNYDYVLKCDDDVILNPTALLSSGFENYDFVGHEYSPKNPCPYGFNYWLSKRAMELVSKATLPDTNNDEAWITVILNRNGIILHHDSGYFMNYAQHLSVIPAGNHGRALRGVSTEPIHKGKYFSWCMHNHSADKKVIFEEFKRIFEREVRLSATSNMLHV